MEHRDDIIDFSELINKVYFQVLSYLPLENILETRITCRKIKEVVETYIRKHRPIFLRRLPPNTIYTEQNIVNACLYRKIKELLETYIRKHRPIFLRRLPPNYTEQNIVNACLYLVCKQPEECNTTLNCTVSSKSLAPESIEINPSLETLRVIGMSGVKTELNIQFDLVNMTSFKDNIQILEQIIEYLPHTQSMYIRFSESKYYSERGDWVAGTWFNKTARALINLQELSSLRISGDAPWEHILDCLPHLINLRKLQVTCNDNLIGDELIESLCQMTELTSLSISRIQINATELTDCLRLMPQLGSLSISRVKINGLDCQQLGQGLEIALPKLRELVLRHVDIETGNIYDEYSNSDIFPHMRNLLSKLTSLTLSSYQIGIIEMIDIIVPGITGYVSNLKSLNLSCNYIGQTYTDQEGPQMMPFFESLTNLEELSLARNGINPNCITDLIPALQMLPSLRKLDLSNNYLGKRTIMYISQSLPDVTVNTSFCFGEPDEEQDDGESDDEEKLSSSYFSPLLVTDPSVNQLSICRKCLDGDCPIHYECETTAEEEGMCERHLPNWRKFCGQDILSEDERAKMRRWLSYIQPDFPLSEINEMTDEELCEEINSSDRAWRTIFGRANFVSEDGSILEDAVSMKPFSILPHEMVGRFKHSTSTGVDAMKYVDLGALEKQWKFQDESDLERTVPQFFTGDGNYTELIRRWENRIRFVNEQFGQKDIPELIDILSHGSANAKEKAAQKLSEMSRIVDHRSSIINGIIPLIDLLSLGNEDINTYASIIIANLTIDPQHTRMIVQNGAIKPLVALLKGDNLECKRHAVYALAHIAEDNRLALVDEDIIDTLVEMMKDENNLATVDDDELLLYPVVIIENFLKGTKDYRELVLSKNTLEPLVNLLKSRNVRIQKHVLEALRYLTVLNDLTNLNIYTLEESIKPILLFIQNDEEYPDSSWIAARVIATFALNETLREIIVLEDGVNILRDLFIRGDIREKIISTIAIANISLNNSYQYEIMSSGIVEPIGELLTHEDENAKKWARIVLENIGILKKSITKPI